MSKHTPGPWLQEGSRVYARALLAGEYIPIAQDASEANARLIAAAPDILEALKLVTEALHRYAGTETPLYEITQAKAAIKKAEGI